MRKKKTIFTKEDLSKMACADLNLHLLSEVARPRKSKYRNKKVEVNGILFDSIKEGNRYKVLCFRQDAGIIASLRLQVPYELNPGGTHSLKYVADFVYIDVATGQEVVEDCKGYRTREYKRKKTLMLKVHGITIKES